MPTSTGNSFRDLVVAYIQSWSDGLEVLTEVNVGARFVNKPRKLDVVIRNKDNNRFMAIECKYQDSQGTADQKLAYTLDDCLASPIPTIIAFCGSAIGIDMKSKLITSGIGLELGISTDPNPHIIDKDNLFRQRCYIELGIDWFPIATGDRIRQQLRALRP